MRFTVREIENTAYKYIDLEEHFKGLEDWPKEEGKYLDFNNFDLLLEEDKEILFAMDPEDLKELLKGTWEDEVSKISREISFIALKEFVDNIKNKRDIELKSIYSWNKTSYMSPYFYTYYTMETLEFSIYDLEKKEIKVFEPVFKDNKIS